MIAVKLATKVLSATDSRCAQSWSLESRKVLQKQIPIALLSSRNHQSHLPNLTPSHGQLHVLPKLQLQGNLGSAVSAF